MAEGLLGAALLRRLLDVGDLALVEAALFLHRPLQAVAEGLEHEPRLALLGERGLEGCELLEPRLAPGELGRTRRLPLLEDGEPGAELIEGAPLGAQLLGEQPHPLLGAGDAGLGLGGGVAGLGVRRHGVRRPGSGIAVLDAGVVDLATETGQLEPEPRHGGLEPALLGAGVGVGHPGAGLATAQPAGTWRMHGDSVASRGRRGPGSVSERDARGRGARRSRPRAGSTPTGGAAPGSCCPGPTRTRRRCCRRGGRRAPSRWRGRPRHR